MKITKIEPIICNARMRNWIFVKVHTDQPGLVGWGEATLEWHTKSVVGAIEDLSTLLIGEDPRRIEYLWQMMYRQHFWHGNGAIRGTAISGIDIALWDILGKIYNAPCHELWGGRVRDYVRLYTHLGGGKMEDMYMITPGDANRFADLAVAMVEEGYTAFKCMGVPETANIEGLVAINYAVKCMEAMRNAVGDSIDIMVDAHARQSPRMAIQFAKALEPYGLYWYEEPCWPENMDGIAEVQRAVSTPIATGERLITQHPFRELLEKRAASIIQPDITHCGGLSEVRRIAAMAEAYRVAMAPHNPQGPVSTAASVEFGFATPSYLICEAVHNDVPWRDDIVSWGFTVQKEGQLVYPSSKPGLGVEINEKEIAKHPYQKEVLQRSFLKDGSVTDW